MILRTSVHRRTAALLRHAMGWITGAYLIYTDSKTKARVNNLLPGFGDGAVRLTEDGVAFGYMLSAMSRHSRRSVPTTRSQRLLAFGLRRGGFALLEHSAKLSLSENNIEFATHRYH